MPAIPANFPARREIQSLILRCADLKGDVSPELSSLTHDLITALSNVEGKLSELSETANGHASHKGLEGNGWASQWVENKTYLHTSRGVFNVNVAQQVLKTPEGRLIGTARYRLTVGEDTHQSSNTRLLRNLLSEYLQRFEDILPFSVHDVLDRFFATEGDDAVQVEGAAALDVRRQA